MSTLPSPEPAAAASISRASSRFLAIRAWQRTCLPADRAASVAGRWLTGGVAMTTASTSGDSATSCQSRTICRMPNSTAA